MQSEYRQRFCLKKYWSIKESSFFFDELISHSSNLVQETVAFVSDNYRLFLHTKELRESFCNALDSLHDNSYVYSVTEHLILNGCDVNNYYIKVTLEKSEVLNASEALSIIDHSFSILPDKLLRKKKKQLIRQLIGEQNFVLSESAAKSLINLDGEAETLLAEVYYNKGKVSSDSARKKECYYWVLSLCESKKVNTSFTPSQNDVLKELCILSQKAYDADRGQEAYEILDRIKGY